ncbi:MAG: hypothetical protein U0U67_16325 [Chitinophagales bacterium]
MNHTSIKIVELIHLLDNNTIEIIKNELENDIAVKTDAQMLFHAICKNKLYQLPSDTAHLIKSLSKKQKYTPNEFRKLCHSLLQKVESILALITLKNDVLFQHYFLLKFYRQHQLFNFYEQAKNKIDKHENTLFSTSVLEHNMLINQSYYETLIEDKTRASENNILPYSKALDEYYIVQKLKLICHALNEQHFTTLNIVPNYSNEILNINKKQYSILIQLYYDVAKLLQDINREDAFIDLKAFVKESKNIHQDDLKIIIQYLINYCVIKINKGNSNFIREIFEMYKHYDEVIHETYISPVRFKNIINVSIRLKEYNYAFLYIEKNGKKLPVEVQTSTIEFNKAKLYYEQKNYDAAIEILRTHQYDDIIFNLSAKVLLVQSFYEKKEFQFLESFLESFRIFILRNKEMNTASKKIHQDFIKVIHRLMKMEFASNKEIESFKNKINTTENLPDKAWILEKLDAF